METKPTLSETKLTLSLTDEEFEYLNRCIEIGSQNILTISGGTMAIGLETLQQLDFYAKKKALVKYKKHTINIMFALSGTMNLNENGMDGHTVLYVGLGLVTKSSKKNMGMKIRYLLNMEM